ncbi:AzlC family ABC transporter permease [Bombella sp. TMW 2.2559]|uniref:AzlC family ABC transporter permease n=1 Tax=Bombella dulcis TaxID=2967339 RepID=A0ABT3WCT1_9PROT|nr:AzlC family ABC transporter permease [Bombella dulcis]MCX5616189.1 AzlC family ABC transporter permease [Bombella dulcis]
MQTTSLTDRQNSFRAEFFRGVKTSLPLLIAFVPFGLLLGSQAVQKGFSILEVPLLTGLNFAGGSEFAAVGLWSIPPAIMLLAGVTFLINSRHILMGAALAPHLKHLPRWKIFLLLFFMCDEVWALTLTDLHARPGHRFSTGFYAGITVCLYLTWVIFTFMGGYTGNLLGDLTRYGVDMAFPAVFIMLLKGMWKGARNALPWCVSLGVAVLVHLLLPGAWYVPAGALAGITTAFLVVRGI